MPDVPQKNYPGDGVAGINSPEISKSLTPRRRSVETAEEAQEIIKRLIDENRERNTKNARIMAKYNAEAPYKAAKLRAEGLDWQSNFSTKPLSTLIDKIAPRFVSSLEDARYLTASRLPDDAPNAAAKTEFFRSEVTKTVRAHPTFKDDTSNVAQENALFGYCAVGWTDEVGWWPKFFRQDEFYVPQGAKHTPESFQIAVLKEAFLPHELFEQISAGREEADLAGWHVDNVVKAINDAAPTNVSGSSDDARKYEDLLRESGAAMSHKAGAKVVEVYHLFAQEVTGKITHWILSANDYDELFYLEDRYDSMADAVGPYTFQHANGRLHGSKGVGREVYNMAGVIDRSRNAVVDRLHVAGKLLFSGDEKMLKRFRLSMVGNAIVFPNTFSIQQTKVDGNVESSLKLDEYMVRLLDQMVGAATPKEFMGERVTKAAVDLYAAREEERRDSTLSRFLSCFARTMSTVQKRLLAPDNPDPAAQQLRQKLLTRLTPEEVEYLRNQPAAATVADYTQLENQMVATIATEHAADPLFNQKELRRRKLCALLGAEFADAVLLPDNDPTETAEQTRFQLLENALISLGKSVPVSPRDNHKVHIGVVGLEAQEIAQAVATDETAFTLMKGLAGHARAHLDMALQNGAPAGEFAEEKAQIEAIEKQLADLEQQQLAAQQQVGGGLPGGVAGVPADVAPQAIPAASAPAQF